jgi:hypothetical protein
MTPLKMIALLVLLITISGLIYGLVKAFKDKDEAKKKSIGISLGVMCAVFLIIYTVFP